MGCIKARVCIKGAMLPLFESMNMASRVLLLGVFPVPPIMNPRLAWPPHAHLNHALLLQLGQGRVVLGHKLLREVDVEAHGQRVGQDDIRQH